MHHMKTLKLKNLNIVICLLYKPAYPTPQEAIELLLEFWFTYFDRKKKRPDAL